MLVIQKAPRTADVPVLQYSDTTVDVPVAKQRREDTTETARRLHDEHNEIQMDKKPHSAELRTENNHNVFDSESRSDLSSPCRRTPR